MDIISAESYSNSININSTYISSLKLMAPKNRQTFKSYSKGFRLKHLLQIYIDIFKNRIKHFYNALPSISVYTIAFLVNQ